MSFDPDQALEAAMQLFWRAGYEATSMQDLLKAMHLSKSSLYQTFGSKQDLFQRCLERYSRDFSQHLRATLQASANGREFVESLFDFIAAEGSCDEKKGCILVNTANELGQRDENIAKLVGKGIGKLTEILELAVISGQQQGVIDRNKDAKALADFLVVNICGMRTMVKGGADEKTLLNVAKTTLSVLG